MQNTFEDQDLFVLQEKELDTNLYDTTQLTSLKISRVFKLEYCRVIAVVEYCLIIAEDLRFFATSKHFDEPLNTIERCYRTNLDQSNAHNVHSVLRQYVAA